MNNEKLKSYWFNGNWEKVSLLLINILLLFIIIFHEMRHDTKNCKAIFLTKTNFPELLYIKIYFVILKL